MKRLTRHLHAPLGTAQLIAALLFAGSACGGDTNDGTATPTRATRTTSASGTAAAGVNTLDELIDAYLAGVDGKITYRTTSENFGEHPNLLWTSYRLGDRARVDWKNVVENPEDDPMISTIVIVAPDASYVCSTSPGIKSCNARTPEEAQSTVFWLPIVTEPAEAIDAGIEGIIVSSPQQRDIAGVEATCYQMEVPSRIGAGPPGEESIELCFSAEGALLSMSRTVTFTDPAFPTSQLDIVAQEAGEATEADFAPIASPLS